jgi:hypothetical protein
MKIINWYIILLIILHISCTQSERKNSRVLYKNSKSGQIVRIDSNEFGKIKSSASFSKIDNSDFLKMIVYDTNMNIIEEREYLDDKIGYIGLFFYDNSRLFKQKGYNYFNNEIKDSFEFEFQYIDQIKGHRCKIVDIISDSLIRSIDFSIDSINLRSTTKTFIYDGTSFLLDNIELSQFDANWNEKNTISIDKKDNSYSYSMNRYDSKNRLIFELIMDDNKFIKCSEYIYDGELLSEISTFNEYFNKSKIILTNN